jgi:hypothetical protein
LTFTVPLDSTRTNSCDTGKTAQSISYELCGYARDSSYKSYKKISQVWPCNAHLATNYIYV